MKIAERAKLAEDLGFDSYWVIDHLLVAKDRYRNPVLEPLSLLSFLTGRTSRIRFGTSILIVPLRDPILLAKELATLDGLSNGRITLGAASGWCREEFDAEGISFEERGKRFNEQIVILKRLWTEDNVTFKGNFFSFSDITIDPKPVQKPHIPIWLGAENVELNSPLQRIAALGNGWIGVTSPRHYEKGSRKLDEFAIRAGKDPSSIERANFTYVMVDKNGDMARESAHIVLKQIHSDAIMYNVEKLLVAGSPEEVKIKIRNQINAGVRYIILNILSEDPDVLHLVSEKVLPEFS